MSGLTKKEILVLGGDGFCGWPTSLQLSASGHNVTIVDNLSRRLIDEELGADSLTPIASIQDRLAAWHRIGGDTIKFVNLDIAKDYDELSALLYELKPDTVIHFAEQRAAPYSMKGPAQKCYTVDNNINATHNLLVALADLGLDTHIIHLGTMGVYGYGGAGIDIPEGYLEVQVEGEQGTMHPWEILFPTSPGSVYHMTKSLDQIMFQYYARNDKLRITDLHQGIVWGTQTEETRRDEALINRFDYDGDFGTVLNRFLIESAVGYPLTVHGTGGQTRAFIHIEDSVRCVALAVENPPKKGDRVSIMNQITECHCIRDLAGMVSDITGADIAFTENPRNEAESNNLKASNRTFIDLGLEPMTLANGLLNETIEISRKYAHRLRKETIPCFSTWTRDQKPGVVDAETSDKIVA